MVILLFLGFFILFLVFQIFLIFIKLVRLVILLRRLLIIKKLLVDFIKLDNLHPVPENLDIANKLHLDFGPPELDLLLTDLLIKRFHIRLGLRLLHWVTAVQLTAVEILDIGSDVIVDLNVILTDICTVVLP